MGQATATADHTAYGCRGAQVVDQAAVVGDVAQHRTGAAAVADLQRAATIDGGAAGVDIVTAQGQRAGAALHQATGATEHTAEGGAAVVAAGGQGRTTQHHAGSSYTGQATNALVATGTDVQRTGTGQIDRARTRQGATGPHRQRAAVDGGVTGVGAGTAQGDRCCAILEQAASAADRAVQGQRVAAGKGQRAAGQLHGIGQGQRAGAVQAGIAAHGQRAGSQCIVVTQGKATGVECHATAEGTAAGQALDASTILHQATGTGNVTSEGRVSYAIEGQRAAAERDRTAGNTGQ